MRRFMWQTSFKIEERHGIWVVHLQSEDGTNRLTRNSVISLAGALRDLSPHRRGVIIAGNDRFFSAGAELEEVGALTAPTACEFSKQGQALMNAVQNFPAPVYAAISGYCMGGGLDLAISCRRRIAASNAVFGHRGAALGLITGWGGTQRLPRLIGKGRALEMFIVAEKVHATRALEIGLIDGIAEDPVAEAIARISES
jgi:enoyl-CoA hydratase/carnithine racemase